MSASVDVARRRVVAGTLLTSNSRRWAPCVPSCNWPTTAAANLEICGEVCRPYGGSCTLPDPRLGVRVLVVTDGDAAADATPSPVVCLQYVGAGRVVFQSTDESYLWSRFDGTDIYYERYWIQLIRYLSRAKLLGTSRASN